MQQIHSLVLLQAPNYTENMLYDKSGNIKQLTRWDNQDIMNLLHYTYDGNQLTKVTDEGYYPVDYSCKRYMDLVDEAVEMGYDANGNLIYDLDRQIVAIRYNILNLPDTVQFANGNQIINHYDALGNRYKTSYRTRKVAATVPVGTTLSATDNLSDYTLLTHAMDGNIKYMAYGNSALTLDYVFNSEGYYSNLTDAYYYYIKDHLGNIRETYVYPWANYKECVQRMQYYPSGLPWNETWNASEQPYKYNGKEFVEMHGLDEYDSEARWYYPALGRTTTIDPLAELYYNTTPYAWCGNNTINAIDPNGMDWYRKIDTETGDTIIRWTSKTSQEEMDQANIDGEYLGEAYIDIRGNYNEILSADGKIIEDATFSSLIKIYGCNGANDTASYYGLTMSSNPDMFSVVATGEYRAHYQDMARAPYGTKGSPQCSTYLVTTLDRHPHLPIEGGGLNKYNPNQAYMDAVFLHRTNKDGFAGQKNVRGKLVSISAGCIIIDYKHWTKVQQQLAKSPKIYIKLQRK